MSDCTFTVPSMADEDHDHVCDGTHDEDDYHHCARCGYWFWASAPYLAGLAAKHDGPDPRTGGGEDRDLSSA